MRMHFAHTQSVPVPGVNSTARREHLNKLMRRCGDKMTEQMTFAQFLRAVRNELDMGQKHMSEIVGISQSDYCKIENGRHDMRRAHFERFIAYASIHAHPLVERYLGPRIEAIQSEFTPAV